MELGGGSEFVIFSFCCLIFCVFVFVSVFLCSCVALELGFCIGTGIEIQRFYWRGVWAGIRVVRGKSCFSVCKSWSSIFELVLI